MGTRLIYSISIDKVKDLPIGSIGDRFYYERPRGATHLYVAPLDSMVTPDYMILSGFLRHIGGSLNEILGIDRRQSLMYSYSIESVVYLYQQGWDIKDQETQVIADTIIKEESRIFNIGLKKDSNIKLPTFNNNLVLRDHQKSVVEFCQTIDQNPLIALDMRLGKTFAALAYVSTLEFKQCLIVVPAMLRTSWVKALNTIFSNPKINVLDSKDSILKDGYNIVSYNMLDYFKFPHLDICILDEGHYIKNVGAFRTQATYDITADKRLVLTGTPFSNYPSEVIPLLRWLNPGYYDYWYPSRINNGDLVSIFDGYFSESHIIKLLRSRCMIRLRTRDVVLGSDIRINPIYVSVEIPPENLKDRQKVGQSKLSNILDYIKVFDGDKLIVCTCFKELAYQIHESLGDISIIRTGESSAPDKILAEFKDNPDKKVLVCTYQSIKVGIDLSFCSRILFTEPDYSLEMAQVMARCSHNEKTEDIFLDFMLVEGSIDEHIMKILSKKFSHLDELDKF